MAMSRFVTPIFRLRWTSQTRLAPTSTCTQVEFSSESLSNLLRRRREGSHNPFGTIEQIDGVYSPQLDNERDLLISLPGGYSTGERPFSRHLHA